MRLLKKLDINITGTIITLQFDAEHSIQFDSSVNEIDFNTSKNDIYIGLHCAYYGISIACLPENITFNGTTYIDMDTAYDEISKGVSDMVTAGNACDYNLAVNKPSINDIELKSNLDIPAMYWNHRLPGQKIFIPGYGLKADYDGFSDEIKESLMYLTSDTNQIIFKDTVYDTKYTGKDSIKIESDIDDNERILSLVIDPTDKILSQDITGLLSTLSIKKLNNPGPGLASQYALVGIDGNTALGVTIDLVKDQFLKEATVIVKATQADKDIDPSVVVGKPYIKLIFVTTTTDKTVYINIEDLFKLYVAGNGISITYSSGTSEYTIAVKLDPATETYLKFGQNGLMITGIDAALDIIRAYTINGKSIDTNPVLTGTDIKLDGFAEAVNAERILPEDTINIAFGKIQKTILDNELVVARALTEQDSKLKEIDKTLTWEIID